jgi:hypothetical protein|tara:strand:+ start:26 stop:457 length:432 start_codon:yes stop_codon:yes gene_type:complete
MAFKMKYTNGKKADVSSFPFKIEAPSAVSDSPAKFDAAAGAAIGAGLGSIAPGIGTLAGAGIGAGAGLIAGGIANRARTLRDERDYRDEIADAGLERNFFGKIGFGGGKAKAREQLIRDLQEQDQMGIDRERIMARGGTVAGA